MTKNTGALVLIENPNKNENGKTVTDRGFRIKHFLDSYGLRCSVQKSSLATEDAIWLGIDDPEPRIMARDAVKLGRDDLLKPDEPVEGWVPFPIPDEVHITTRMHLTQEQAKALLPYLQHFVETGDLP